MTDRPLPKKMLGEMLSVIETGSRPSGGANSGSFGLPSLGGENISLDGTLDYGTIRFVPSSFFQSMRTGHLKPSDVLLIKDGFPGRVARYNGEFKEACINEHLYLLRGTGEIRQDYLFRVLQFSGTQRAIWALVTGSVQLGLSREFLNLRIPVPSYEEQKFIAMILDDLDKAIHAIEQLNSKNVRLAYGLCSSLIEDNGRSPNDILGWRKILLDDLGTVVGGGTPSRLNPEYWNGSIPWVTPGELTGVIDKYIHKSRDSISDRGLVASGARLLPAQSLLMTSRASIGFCALAGKAMATNQGFQNLIPNTEKVDTSFVYYLCKTLGRELIRRASGTTFLEISGKEFRNIEVRIPPLEEQRRIARILDSTDEMIKANRRELEKLRQLRSGLASDLFSGRVRTVPT